MPLAIELSADEITMLVHILKSRQSIAEATPMIDSLLVRLVPKKAEPLSRRIDYLSYELQAMDTTNPDSPLLIGYMLQILDIIACNSQSIG